MPKLSHTPQQIAQALAPEQLTVEQEARLEVYNQRARDEKDHFLVSLAFQSLDRIEILQHLLAEYERPWTKILPPAASHTTTEKEVDASYPTDYGWYEVATEGRVFDAYFGSSRYGVGSWYYAEDDDRPPFHGIEGITHWRKLVPRRNPNDLTNGFQPTRSR